MMRQQTHLLPLIVKHRAYQPVTVTD